MIARFALAAVLIAAPAAAQPGGEEPSKLEMTAAAQATEAAEAEQAEPQVVEEPTEAAAAAVEQEQATVRKGLRLRAASGSPVGEIARVTPKGVVVRMEVGNKPVLKVIGAEHLEVQGSEAVTDLTVGELAGLPDAR